MEATANTVHSPVFVNLDLGHGFRVLMSSSVTDQTVTIAGEDGKGGFVTLCIPAEDFLKFAKEIQ